MYELLHVRNTGRAVMFLAQSCLCRDSVLAAPLVIELVRLQELAQRRGEGGVQEQLGSFFKLPMVATVEQLPEHALHVQEQRLLAWLMQEASENVAVEPTVVREVGG